MTKPLPALGLVIGVIATYGALLVASYTAYKLVMRIQMFSSKASMLPWLALLVLIAAVLGVLMIVPSIGAGVTTGSGLLLTVAALVTMLLPMRQSFDFVKLFQLPGSKLGGTYMMYDGSLILLGIPLLLVGIRRWALDAKLARLPQGQLQDTFPPQTQQWGGYPGQQPYQPPQHPGQQQPPQYPGQQPPR
ncbi:MAG TPA: hypothetical protein VFH76_12740 [Kribbella sp.]|jgi:hypothetical protein|nr:hypothetical protein [Kribbella sp.]